MDVLEQFGKTDVEELGVTEISNSIGVPKNNVFRVLATLQIRNYVEKNPKTENYRLGVKSLELGKSYLNRMGLLERARPVLEQLVQEIKETAYIGVIRGQEVIYVDGVESPRTVRAVSSVGYRVPSYCTAIGKAQIAFDSEVELLQHLPKQLKSYTPQTLVSSEQLQQELREIRIKGYAVDNEEFEEGLRCIGVPIRDYTRRVIAGICVSAPSFRVPEKKFSEVAVHVIEAGERLSQRLGYTSTPQAGKVASQLMHAI
jgi:DNA-binding IclR family transcriptional regulator